MSLAMLSGGDSDAGLCMCVCVCKREREVDGRSRVGVGGESEPATLRRNAALHLNPTPDTLNRNP